MPEGCASGGCGGKAASGGLPPDIEAVRALYAKLANQEVARDVRASLAERAAAMGRPPPNRSDRAPLSPELERVRRQYATLALHDRTRTKRGGGGAARWLEGSGVVIRGTWQWETEGWEFDPDTILDLEPHIGGGATDTDDPCDDSDLTAADRAALHCPPQVTLVGPCIPPDVPDFGTWPDADCFDGPPSRYDEDLPSDCCTFANLGQQVSVPRTPSDLLLGPTFSFAPAKKDCVLPSGDELLAADVYVGDPGADIGSLFNTAIALLQDNLDLIAWLMCLFQDAMLPGDSYQQLFACLEDLLTSPQSFELRLDGAQTHIMEGNPVTGALEVNPLPGSSFDTQWVQPWLAASTVADQLCVAIRFAALLITELAHVCGVVHPDNFLQLQLQPVLGKDLAQAVAAPLNDVCDYLGFVGMAFTDMMLDRYDCAWEGCCAKWDKRFAFGIGKMYNPSSEPDLCL